MAAKNSTPLGYVELKSGAMAIYPMNDVFLNFTFEFTAHWEALRLAVNLLIEAYKQQKPDTKLNPIEGEIEVRTQFRQFLAAEEEKATFRDQDIKITENKASTTYVEFQNKAKTQPPIKIRSVEYFGLGIGHSRGKIANQIWLLAEDVNEVLHGKSFTRYILKDEVTGESHPESSGIMYVSLTKLTQENTPVGELASFLMGTKTDPQNEVVKKIAKAFNASFQEFKERKDVVTVLSLRERVRDEVWDDAFTEGKNENKAELASQVAELRKRGLDPAEILRMIEHEFATSSTAYTTKNNTATK
jgi:hypothetical protein